MAVNQISECLVEVLATPRQGLRLHGKKCQIVFSWEVVVQTANAQMGSTSNLAHGKSTHANGEEQRRNRFENL